MDDNYTPGRYASVYNGKGLLGNRSSLEIFTNIWVIQKINIINSLKKTLTNFTVTNNYNLDSGIAGSALSGNYYIRLGIGYYAESGKTTEWGPIKLRLYASPEPSVSSWGSEEPYN